MSVCLTDKNQLPERISYQITYPTRTVELGRPAVGKKGSPGYRAASRISGTLDIVDQVETITRVWDFTSAVATAFIAGKRSKTASGRQVKNPKDTTGVLNGTWYRQSITENSRGDGTSRITEVISRQNSLFPTFSLIGTPV